jgi:hypothetical protein
VKRLALALFADEQSFDKQRSNSIACNAQRYGSLRSVPARQEVSVR